MKNTIATTAITVIGIIFCSSGFALPKNPSISFYGDLRTGYFAKERDDRNLTSSDLDEFRLRIRAGIKATLSGQWKFKGRFAGRYSTENNHPHFEFFKSIPSGDGLRAGDSTIDTLNLDYKPNSRWNIRFGRMQTKMELDGVAKKSLDRNDSPNTDITWTDGVYGLYKGKHGWKTHIILQYNSSDGATNVRRSPLNFTASGSRLSYFVAMENKRKVGSIVQRSFGITYLPDSLRKDGTATGRIADYWAFVGRIAAAWPVGRGKTRFLLGLELGYAPETPSEAAKSIGAGDDTGGFAGQVTFNYINFIPKHSVGLVFGRAEAGYLLSPDFRENTNLVEIRYKWTIAKAQKLEARLRRRKDIELPIGGLRKRVDTDLYIRYTYKF